MSSRKMCLSTNSSYVDRYSSSVNQTLSYFHNPGSEPLLYLTIGQLVRRAAEKWPDTPVFQSVQHQTNLTFSQADQQADQLAAGLLDLGLVPGDRIGICSPNCTEWYLTALAAAKTGLILVSLNPAYKAAELEYCLQKVGVRALVTDRAFESTDYFQLIAQFLPSLSRLPHGSKVAADKLPNFQFIIVNSEEKLPGSYRFCDILNYNGNKDKLSNVTTKLRPEHTAVIHLTSGTTGKPKAVPQSHFNFVNNSYCVSKRLGLEKKNHKILAQTPLFHALAYSCALLPALHHGATLVLPSPTFSTRHSCEAIRLEKCTVLLGTPTMYVDLCNHVSSLSAEEQLLYQSPEIAVSGGALCAPQLFYNMKNTFSCDRVVSVYGMTELTAITFQSTPEDSEFLFTSTVGKVSDHVEAKVVDAEGVTVPLGTPGELWMRSYNVMEGYWQDEESTGDMITSDRWLKTGDRVILLKDGYGQVVGRIKELIIRGGENISPKEVEDELMTHPDVLEAQVYGVYNERLGEEVACSIRLKPGAITSEQQIKDFCKPKISHFKVPRYIEFVNTFPKTGSGKIQRFKLKEAMENKLKISVS